MCAEQLNRLLTGIAGLEEILHGGVVVERAYLVRGGPGSGKTVMGLHFLMEGAARGEKALLISLSEPEGEIRKNAATFGFDLSGISFLDLSPTPEIFAEAGTYDIFSPSEVEREPTTRKIIESVEALKPSRVFVDSFTQFRYLSADEFQFRRQVLSFLRFMSQHNTTVMLTSEASPMVPDDDLQFICDGVINLDRTEEGRTVTVTKFRGSSYQGGTHSMKLTDRGMQVFPHLELEAVKREITFETIPSGVPELDELLHGGIERGTATIISGPSGVGKTTTGIQYIKEAAGRGERSVVYAFEEDVETLVRRSEAINVPVHSMMEHGTLAIMRVEPLRYTPDEFAAMVRRDVEEKDTRIVMIDSTSGYRLAMKGKDLVANLYSLSRYLKNRGVTVILISEIENITGDFRATEVGISYLADNIVFLRYLEIEGQLHKAIGVLKKRTGDFEKTLRELNITRYGIKVGRPLVSLRGILTGTPEFIAPPERGGYQ